VQIACKVGNAEVGAEAEKIGNKGAAFVRARLTAEYIDTHPQLAPRRPFRQPPKLVAQDQLARLTNAEDIEMRSRNCASRLQAHVLLIALNKPEREIINVCAPPWNNGNWYGKPVA
jgi:hypothetical protein